MPRLALWACVLTVVVLGGAGAGLAQADQPLPGPLPPPPAPPPPPPPWADAAPSAPPADPFGGPTYAEPTGPLPAPCEAPPSIPAVRQPPITEARVVPPPQVPRVPTRGRRRDRAGWPLDASGCRYGRSDLTIEGMYGFANAPTGLLGTPVFGATNQMSWDAVDYEGNFGGRLTYRYAVCPRNWVELRGTYYGRNEGDATGVGVFGFTPGAGGVPSASQPVNTTLTSRADAWAAEFNYVKEVACTRKTRWDLLGGVHYVQFNEESAAVFAGPPFVNSDVDNLFVGLQVGAVGHWDVSSCFEVNGTVKAMGGYLRREAEVSDDSVFVGGPHLATSKEDDVAFGAEVEVGLKWRLGRCFAITGGYNLLFLDGVLRGWDAFDFSQSQSGAVQAVQKTDQLLIQSVFLGLNVNF